MHAHLANNGISTTNVADIQVQHKTPLHSVEKISLTPYKWKASSIDANSVKTVAFFFIPFCSSLLYQIYSSDYWGPLGGLGGGKGTWPGEQKLWWNKGTIEFL